VRGGNIEIAKYLLNTYPEYIYITYHNGDFYFNLSLQSGNFEMIDFLQNIINSDEQLSVALSNLNKLNLKVLNWFIAYFTTNYNIIKRTPNFEEISNNLLYNITSLYDTTYARNFLQLYPEGIVGFLTSVTENYGFDGLISEINYLDNSNVNKIINNYLKYIIDNYFNLKWSEDLYNNIIEWILTNYDINIDTWRIMSLHRIMVILTIENMELFLEKIPLNDTQVKFLLEHLFIQPSMAKKLDLFSNYYVLPDTL
jgi:hypothetical protein